MSLHAGDVLALALFAAIVTPAVWGSDEQRPTASTDAKAAPIDVPRAPGRRWSQRTDTAFRRMAAWVCSRG